MLLDLAVAADLPSTLLSTSAVTLGETLPSAALAFADQADNAAGPLFAGSLAPYLVFLYFVCQDVNGLDRTAKAGFASLLAFVAATVIASIVAKTQYGTTLANVDWLHASAESLLTLTNIADVVGLKLTLDAALRGQGPMVAMLGAAASDGGGTQRTSDGGGEQRLEDGGGAGGGVSEDGGGGGGGLLGLGGVLGGVPLGVGFFGGFLAALAAGQAMALGVHAPFLGGVGDLPPDASLLGLGVSQLAEPENALSLPTWVIHVSSLLEWLVAMGLVWPRAR